MERRVDQEVSSQGWYVRGWEGLGDGGGGERSRMWTVAPWDDRRWAVARPIPEEPPTNGCQHVGLLIGNGVDYRVGSQAPVYQ